MSWRSRKFHGPRWLWLLLIVAVVLAGVLGLGELRRVRSLYWHDVREDYRYVFSEAEIIPISVEREGVTVPALSQTWHTALLSMEISTTWSSRWSEPALEIEGPAGYRSVQFFEREARGRRYVNLADLLDDTDAAGQWIDLRGHHLRWEEQEAELLLFARPPLEKGPVLVIAPHPDDAEIAAFGLYASTDSWIVTVSAGNYVDRRMVHLAPDPVERNQLHGELRAWDSVMIPVWGGVPPDRVVNLGYFNGSLARMYADPSGVVADDVLNSPEIGRFRRTDLSRMVEGTTPESSWKSLVADLESALAYVQPSTIVAPHPMLDASADHQLTTVALIEAMGRMASARRTLLLYTNHHATSEYFPFGPATGLVTLPPWTDSALWARGVFSHRLDEAGRTRKLYAIEAQHDLRPAPRYVGASPMRRVFGELGHILRELWRDPTDSYSYLRRAVRPNELFLVFSEEDLPRLQASMSEKLAALRAGDAGERADEAYQP